MSLEERFRPTFIKILTRINSPPPGGNVFKQTGTIFVHIQDIRTNILIKFYKDWIINVTLRVKNAPPSSGLFFNQRKPFSKLVQDIIETNLLPILKRFYYSHISNVYQQTGTIFELAQDIIGMYLLTKFHVKKEKSAPPLGGHVFQPTFHEDWTINVASRVLTRINAPPPGGHVFQQTRTIFETYPICH
ncbi:hypothetical protein DPMN_179752 [Dreissena polymorpha]|uniref:Uncharacterized protein n=1 Tax=Dreissena polymorpha TaxID=45954 RepID=A0A9D4IMM2_DREPO|nr:hypothetical protein DPMN_179752 [Dreissena polymorpha]